MKKMIFSAILAGAFLCGTVYAQTPASSTTTQQGTKKEASTMAGKPDAKTQKKGKGKKHGAKKDKASAKPAESK